MAGLGLYGVHRLYRQPRRTELHSGWRSARRLAVSSGRADARRVLVTIGVAAGAAIAPGRDGRRHAPIRFWSRAIVDLTVGSSCCSPSAPSPAGSPLRARRAWIRRAYYGRRALEAPGFGIRDIVEHLEINGGFVHHEGHEGHELSVRPLKVHATKRRLTAEESSRSMRHR